MPYKDPAHRKANDRRRYLTNRSERIRRAGPIGRHRRRLVKKVIHAVKAIEGCVLCGHDDPTALHFHHLRDKRFDIGTGKTRGWRALMNEMCKCEVLCRWCHAWFGAFEREALL